MFMWNVILKYSVLASIWTTCMAQNMPIYFVKSPFDPSTFSEKTTGCHGNCADNYYACCFQNCESNIPGTDNIAADVKNHNTLDHSPSFLSRLLNSLTFGYLGSSFHGKSRSLRSLKYPDETDNLQGNTDSAQVCLNQCKSVFHKCYNKCICDDNPTFQECKPKVDFVNRNAQDNGNTYHFDWNKVS